MSASRAGQDRAVLMGLPALTHEAAERLAATRWPETLWPVVSVVLATEPQVLVELAHDGTAQDAAAWLVVADQAAAVAATVQGQLPLLLLASAAIRSALSDRVDRLAVEQAAAERVATAAAGTLLERLARKA